MRKIRWIILIAAAMLFLGAFSFAAAEEETGPDEWTVMIYFCGSDLESKYGYASENLNEIINVGFPFDISVFFEDLDIPGEAGMQRVEDVNILIETGGSRKWHAQSCNMNIDAKALQRWHYKYVLESAADFAEYQLSDLFMQVTKTDRIEIQWDGETMTFPNDASWTGSF